MFAREIDGTDFRLSRHGDGADPVAAHSMRECREAMVRRRRLSAYLGVPVTPRLARMFAREVDGTDFRLSRNGDAADPVAVHSMRECRGATVRRRRLNASLGFPVADACWREEGVTLFSTVEKLRWGRATLISKP